jgi:hypothetical protein
MAGEAASIDALERTRPGSSCLLTDELFPFFHRPRLTSLTSIHVPLWRLRWSASVVAHLMDK